MVKVSEINTLRAPDGSALNLPEEFIAVLPTTCVCGSALEINETLTKICCPNTHCITKVTQRLTDMLKYLGVLGMGEARCRQFFECIRIYNPYAIFAWTMDDYAKFNGVFSREFLQNIYDQLADHRSFTLAEFVKIGYLPDIQDGAFKLFKNYSSMSAFYADLDAQGITLIADLMGLRDTSVTVTTTYETLQVYRNDLLAGEQFVHIKSNVKTLNVCISTAVGAPYKSKQDFVNQINTKYGDKFHLNWLSSVTQSGCDYLICADKNATTSKAVKARKYGVPIISGQEFEKMIIAM